MKWKVALYPSDEGFAVCVPSLPGCWSQGTTEEEALANIADAIREYLDSEIEPTEGAEVREVEDGRVACEIDPIHLHAGRHYK